MDQKKKTGFLNLAKKTIAVISASLSTLSVHAEEPNEHIPTPELNFNTIEELALKKELKPQFMLRLSSNFEKSLVFMHTSHRSHSSHSSHRSHSSHSSHYSSSSGYYPSVERTTYPAYTPPRSSTSSHTPQTTSSKPTTRSKTLMSTISRDRKYSGANILPSYTLEAVNYYYRELRKNCEGLDVEYLQRLLKEIGFNIPTTGYFGNKTEQAVKKFQDDSELKPTGIVDDKTFSTLKEKVDEL